MASEHQQRPSSILRPKLSNYPVHLSNPNTRIPESGTRWWSTSTGSEFSATAATAILHRLCSLWLLHEQPIYAFLTSAASGFQLPSTPSPASIISAAASSYQPQRRYQWSCSPVLSSESRRPSISLRWCTSTHSFPKTSHCRCYRTASRL